MHKRGIASPLVGRAAFVPPKQDFTETVFNQFVKAETLRGSLSYFFTICEQTGLKQFENHDTFYNSLKEKVKFWRANSLWSLLTPLKEREEYKNGAICAGQKVSESMVLLPTVMIHYGHLFYEYSLKKRMEEVSWLFN